jgi:hypothetical protein
VAWRGSLPRSCRPPDRINVLTVRDGAYEAALEATEEDIREADLATHMVADPLDECRSSLGR